MKRQHILLVDPIAYAGGSKIATVRMLEMLDTRNTRVTIVTRDPASWESLAAETSPLFELNLLAGKEQGTAYFLRHILIVFSLLWARLRFGRFDRALGASGPGIDLSLYLARRLFGYQVIQLIHGPVARSRTIGRALRAADRIFYLESTRQSLLRAMESVQPALASGPGLDNEKFIAFNNGLPADRWPSASEATETGIFWASSLLKWKGLATLIGSLKSLSVSLRPQTHICYIRPRDTRLELGPGPVEIERVHWYENPPNLDQIRASCNIFVSTSSNEPFGLSILESMAAGLAIIIPADGAYWDRQLQDKQDCLKYRADDPMDLALKILFLKQNPEILQRLGQAARERAGQHRSDRVYRRIIDCLAPAQAREPGLANDADRVADHV